MVLKREGGFCGSESETSRNQENPTETQRALPGRERD